MFAWAGGRLVFTIQRHTQVCAQGQALRSTARSSQMVEKECRCFSTTFCYPCLGIRACSSLL